LRDHGHPQAFEPDVMPSWVSVVGLGTLCILYALSGALVMRAWWLSGSHRGYAESEPRAVVSAAPQTRARSFEYAIRPRSRHDDANQASLTVPSRDSTLS